MNGHYSRIFFVVEQSGSFLLSDPQGQFHLLSQQL